ncbi:hypothetical protein, variant [Fonticula alba]|nr:hypothetical protein, variant [Fonticula alba]KCV68284.1 hypothetical protein, variant [Fonticula alba]|eukprot:XP_009497338.1 hypothetical protein, variant [Fonticula alba]
MRSGYFIDDYLPFFMQPLSGDAGPEAVISTAEGSARIDPGCVHSRLTRPAFALRQVAYPDRRPPVINRGTYIRVRLFDWAVEAFLRQPGVGPGSLQVVSIGAGFDTRPFYLSAGARENLRTYVEVDFPEVVARKMAAMQQADHFAQTQGLDLPFASVYGPLHASAADGDLPLSLTSEKYALVAADAADTAALGRALFDVARLDRHRPTLFLFECVMVYIRPAAADGLFAWLVAPDTGFSSVGMLLFEMIGGGDHFGEMMVKNLKSRNIQLPGLLDDLGAHRARLQRAGFLQTPSRRTGFAGFNLHELFARVVSRAELRRLNTLEPLDEVEEWALLMSHYVMYCGYSEAEAAGAKSATQQVAHPWEAFQQRCFAQGCLESRSIDRAAADPALGPIPGGRLPDGGRTGGRLSFRAPSPP